MKNKILTSLITLTAVMGITACFNKPAADALKNAKVLRDPSELSHNYANSELNDPNYISFANKIREFSMRLTDSFVNREFDGNKNIVISPLSIEMCLGLAISGANGKTRQEMLDAIGVDYETFSKYYKLFYNQSIFKKFTNTNQYKSELSLTNSIWIDDEVDLLDSGLDDLKDNYYCHSFNVDFNKQNKKANAAIREFNKEKTHNLIDADLNISLETWFVLMNTLYLKDIWKQDGSDLSYASNEYTFTNYNDQVSKKKLLMGRYFDGRSYVNDDISAFYTRTDSYLSLYFVKANEGKDIKDVFKENAMADVLNAKNYVTIDKEKKEIYHTNCFFPEYSADADINLIDMFKEDFNVSTLFDDRCDFSNLSKESIHCSDFRHVAKLKVDKKGIEGAAVTYMEYEGQGMPDETWTDVYESFVVDKEFGFILTHDNDIVFSGIVTNID